MNFDVYRSVGPQVDVSLFGDAAARGAALGKAIPSAISSIVTGAQEGYKYGQEAEARSQQNEIRQHQIEQQPVQDAMDRAQLESQQALAKIRGLEAIEAEQTQSLAIKDKETALKARTAKNQNDLELQQQADKLQDIFATGNPEEQALAFLGGQFAGVFSKDKDLFQAYGRSVLANPNNKLDQGQRDQLRQVLDIKGVQDRYAKLAEQHLDEFVLSERQMASSPLTNAITKGGLLGNIPTNDYYNNVEFEQAGRYKIQNGKVLKNPDGSWMEDPDVNLQSENRDKYDVFSKEGKLLYSGKQDYAGITVKGKEAYDKYAAELQIQNGVQAAKATSQITQQDKQQNQQNNMGSPQTAGRGVPTFGEPPPLVDSFSPAQITNPVTSAIGTKLNLGEKEIRAIEPSADALKGQLYAYATSASFRASPQANVLVANTVASIARGVTDTQFDNDPKIKETYNQEAVEKYNASLRRAFKQSNSSFFNNRASSAFPVISAISDELFGDNEALYDAYKVNSPKDLYFVNQRSNLENNIFSAVNGIITNYQAKQQQAVNRQVSKNKNNAKFAEAVRGN